MSEKQVVEQIEKFEKQQEAAPLSKRRKTELATDFMSKVHGVEPLDEEGKQTVTLVKTQTPLETSSGHKRMYMGFRLVGDA